MNREYKKTKKRVITRRGVIWLGQTCNLRCKFCYFVDRVKKKQHPEHPFMSLEKAHKICKTLVETYHNNAIDIQGGEPTIYPDIIELVSYCREIGLLPTLITNGIILASKDFCMKLTEAGVRDYLVSVHGIGETYDDIVCVPGAFKRQMKALENMQELGIPFRFNCVLSKWALPDLRKIAEIAINRGARVVNFIAYNPFEDQHKKGKRSSENVPTYSEVASQLNGVLDMLEDSGIESNVRYFPICMLEKRHRKSAYNFQQLPYDIHEWDYASWCWTAMKEQRMKRGDTAPIAEFRAATYGRNIYKGVLRYPAVLAKCIMDYAPFTRNVIKIMDKKVERMVRQDCPPEESPGHNCDIEELYRRNGRNRAESCNLRKDACDDCDAYAICDGFHKDYVSIFGIGEAKTITLGKKVDDPKYFIAGQEKIVEAEDYEWVFGTPAD